MKTDEALKQIADKDFLDKIYQFSYHRCSTSVEAEDLCSDIVLAVLSSIPKQDKITNFHAFVWTIAHRVYADFCEKRKNGPAVSIEDFADSGGFLAAKENEIDRFVEEMTAAAQLKKIFGEIAFLSKAYRDVMVMYYIDEIKVRDIARRLNLSETTVKQRLFSARNIVRKEVGTMNNRTLSLKPIHLEFIGTGNPMGNDPRIKAERTFSQNLIYLCRNKPKTAKELSEELCVPMPYIEEELEIQCRGENGAYGTIRELNHGKYVTNILLPDYAEYVEAGKIYGRHLPEFCAILKRTLEQDKDKMLSFPYLNPQKDIRFLLWPMISWTVWNFEDRINKTISDKFFSEVAPTERAFSCIAIAYRKGAEQDSDCYGSDGINAADIAGYKAVFVSNLYGKRLDAHFHCGHNISLDSKLLMALKAVGGFPVDELTETEKEIAAKALECGYLYKEDNRIVPKMVVFDRKNEEDFIKLACGLNRNMQDVVDAIAGELAVFMKAHIPEHLMNEYQLYQMIAGGSFLSQVIEECIRRGMLLEPENRVGAEGMYMVVET